MKVRVNLNERSYDIEISPGLLEKCGQDLGILPSPKCLVVTDDNVKKLYYRKLADSLSLAGISCTAASFNPGEGSKNLDTMAFIYGEAVHAGLNRKSFIVALGGGVPGDMAGFAAATYMRGIDFIQVPTSLLAMVDSSVGGKTGIDLPEGKNLVGAFWQPKKVFIDPGVLKTLPEREIKCGLAEVVKYGVILDSAFFDLLAANITRLLSLDLDFYSSVIAKCCELKAHVVSNDEREGGLRAILNYGHTFGHAVEAVSGYQGIAHGEAVSIGMCMAADLAVSLKMMKKEYAFMQEELLKKLGLPVRVPKGLISAEILEAMGTDKKKTDAGLTLVLPLKIGAVELRRGVDPALVLEAIRGRCD
ncbi:MAG: 3-dehydroquinate synthase [Victivallales bacterium]